MYHRCSSCSKAKELVAWGTVEVDEAFSTYTEAAPPSFTCLRASIDMHEGLHCLMGDFVCMEGPSGPFKRGEC